MKYWSILLIFVFFTCNQKDKSVNRIISEPFGHAPDGTPVELFTITNINGLTAQITNYGGIITTLKVPDRNGTLDDIVLGYYTLEQYLEKSPHFGCLVGRFGNRIANGTFSLDSVDYKLAKNNGPNHLHGGLEGFDKKVWKPEIVIIDDAAGIK